MKVGEMCSRGVVPVFESASLREVAALMKERHVGAVVVIRKFLSAPQPVGDDLVAEVARQVSTLARLLERQPAQEWRQSVG